MDQMAYYVYVIQALEKYSGIEPEPDDMVRQRLILAELTDKELSDFAKDATSHSLVGRA